MNMRYVYSLDYTVKLKNINQNMIRCDKYI